MGRPRALWQKTTETASRDSDLGLASWGGESHSLSPGGSRGGGWMTKGSFSASFSGDTSGTIYNSTTTGQQQQQFLVYRCFCLPLSTISTSTSHTAVYPTSRVKTAAPPDLSLIGHTQIYISKVCSPWQHQCLTSSGTKRDLCQATSTAHHLLCPHLPSRPEFIAQAYWTDDLRLQSKNRQHISVPRYYHVFSSIHPPTRTIYSLWPIY